MIGTLKNIIKGLGQRFKNETKNPYKTLNINWFHLRVLKNKPVKDSYEINFLNGNISFKALPEFLHGLDEIFFNNIYSIKFSNTRPNIIDCGGHIGLSALYFKKEHPDAKVTVFEPDPTNFKFLEKNIASQKLEDVHLYNAAVWDENTTLQFSADESMSSRVTQATSSISQSVRALRLKDFIDDEIDLLKMDIESAEYVVLKDILPKMYLIKNMFIEYHGSFNQQKQLIDILHWVDDAGFTYYIKEAFDVYPTPFNKNPERKNNYDIQLNIFCFRM